MLNSFSRSLFSFFALAAALGCQPQAPAQSVATMAAQPAAMPAPPAISLNIQPLNTPPEPPPRCDAAFVGGDVYDMPPAARFWGYEKSVSWCDCSAKQTIDWLKGRPLGTPDGFVLPEGTNAIVVALGEGPAPDWIKPDRIVNGDDGKYLAFLPETQDSCKFLRIPKKAEISAIQSTRVIEVGGVSVKSGTKRLTLSLRIKFAVTPIALRTVFRKEVPLGGMGAEFEQHYEPNTLKARTTLALAAVWPSLIATARLEDLTDYAALHELESRLTAQLNRAPAAATKSVANGAAQKGQSPLDTGRDEMGERFGSASHDSPSDLSVLGVQVAKVDSADEVPGSVKPSNAVPRSIAPTVLWPVTEPLVREAAPPAALNERK